MLLLPEYDRTPSDQGLGTSPNSPIAGHEAAEGWPLSPMFCLSPAAGMPHAPGAAAEVSFSWRASGAVPAALAQRLCGELVIRGVAPQHLLRLRLCAGELELLGLQTLNGNRGDRITAGEMLWGMAAFQSQNRLGRMVVPIFPQAMALEAVRLQLWLAEGVAGRCQVDAVAVPATAG